MILGHIGNRHLTGIIFRDSKVTSWKVGDFRKRLKTSKDVRRCPFFACCKLSELNDSDSVRNMRQGQDHYAEINLAVPSSANMASLASGPVAFPCCIKRKEWQVLLTQVS